MELEAEYLLHMYQLTMQKIYVHTQVLTCYKINIVYGIHLHPEDISIDPIQDWK